MRAETYRALDAYEKKTGKKWEADLSRIRPSLEGQLIADINRAIQDHKPKKRSASQMVRVPSRSEREGYSE